VYLDKTFGPGVNDLGFGPNRGLNWALDPFPGHGLRDVIVNSDLNMFGVNTELLGWSIGSLILIGAAIFLGSLDRTDSARLAAIAAVIGTHALYWFSGGPDFGARYWYLILLPCVALAARGMNKLAGRESSRQLEGDPRIKIAVFALCVMSFLNYVPW